MIESRDSITSRLTSNRQAFIEKLGRRINEPGGFVYTTDLTLLMAAYALLADNKLGTQRRTDRD